MLLGAQKRLNNIFERGCSSKFIDKIILSSKFKWEAMPMLVEISILIQNRQKLQF